MSTPTNENTTKFNPGDRVHAVRSIPSSYKHRQIQQDQRGTVDEIGPRTKMGDNWIKVLWDKNNTIIAVLPHEIDTH